jgi:hypothetical protein
MPHCPGQDCSFFVSSPIPFLAFFLCLLFLSKLYNDVDIMVSFNEFLFFCILISVPLCLFLKSLSVLLSNTKQNNKIKQTKNYFRSHTHTHTHTHTHAHIHISEMIIALGSQNTFWRVINELLKESKGQY